MAVLSVMILTYYLMDLNCKDGRYVGQVPEDPLAKCPDYGRFATKKHLPLLEGDLELPFQRPDTSCRRIAVQEVDQVIQAVKGIVKDEAFVR